MRRRGAPGLEVLTVELGVNFVRGSREGVGFNYDAIRALRPPFVRIRLTDPENAARWADAARVAKLRVLWCLPVEEIGPAAARHTVRNLRHTAWDLSCGLELGDTPAATYALGAGDFLGRMTAIATLADGKLGPAVLGVGFDGSSRSAAFLSAVLRAGHRMAGTVHETFQGGFGVRTRAGRPFGRYHVLAVALRLQSAFGVPIAVTAAGWQAGERLGAWAGLRETWRELWTVGLEAREQAYLTADTRTRWTVQAFEEAGAAGARWFVAGVPGERPDGINAWGCYNPTSGRPDPAWTRMLWRASAPRASLDIR